MDTMSTLSSAAVSFRLLLQTNDSSSTLVPKSVSCGGPMCLIFNILVIVIILFCAMIILAVALYKKLRYSRAVSRGSLPAKYLVSQWSVKPQERVNLALFSYPVRRPKVREEVDEADCPICLSAKPKPKSWIIFGVCNHAVCNSCFRKLVADQKLHAACPICRTVLVQGEGGLPPKPLTDQPVTTTDPQNTTTTPADADADVPAEAGAPAAIPVASANNV